MLRMPFYQLSTARQAVEFFTFSAERVSMASEPCSPDPSANASHRPRADDGQRVRGGALRGHNAN